MFDLFQKDCARAPKTLRPHQERAIAQIKQSLGKGNKRIVCQAATGFGKTLLSAKIIEGALAKRNGVIFTAPAISLIDQTVNAFEAEGIRDIGVMQANHPRTDPLAKVQVASVQTLARREIPPAALVIVDECFPAGTMVSTPFGSAPIEQVKPGDMVLTAAGPGIVDAVSLSTTEQLYKVEIDDGTIIECTAGHPFFTERGWLEAGRLAAGSVVFGAQDMPDLWRGVFTKAADAGGGERSGVGQASGLLAILLKEIEESFTQQANARKDIEDVEAYISSACGSWWERNWLHHAATVPASGLGRGLGDGADSECLEGNTQAGLAGPLQAGYRESGSDDCDRGGRREPRHNGTAGSGRSEGSIPARRRVVSVSRVECGSDVDVYNLEVGGHPSYFANGVLVHNCHLRAKVVEQLMLDRPDVVFIGLSATPWARGMGLLWQDMVTPCSIGDLIGQGYLSEFRVFAPDIPDLSGVKTMAGDFHEGQTAEIMEGRALMASMVETWLAKGENRPTLLFGVNCAHARQLADAFERAGVATAYCDAYTDSVERQVIERRFRAGEVKVACSVRTLTTGVDWPVSCIIDAAPTKSIMLHVQKIGRGLRVNEGTEDLLVLDHAGNSLRLGLVTDINRHELDKTKPGEKLPVERKEKLPKECANCAALHTGLKCPYCGNERKPVAGVETVDGELIELTPAKAKSEQATKAEKQLFYSMALWMAGQRGYKPGWAANLYRGKFQVWPRGLDDIATPADQAFLNYEKSRRIAYAKRRAV